jgi:hypothetical protein
LDLSRRQTSTAAALSEWAPMASRRGSDLIAPRCAHRRARADLNARLEAFLPAAIGWRTPRATQACANVGNVRLIKLQACCSPSRPDRQVFQRVPHVGGRSRPPSAARKCCRGRHVDHDRTGHAFAPAAPSAPGDGRGDAVRMRLGCRRRPPTRAVTGSASSRAAPRPT